jgi:hypothetical protein
MAGARAALHERTASAARSAREAENSALALAAASDTLGQPLLLFGRQRPEFLVPFAHALPLLGRQAAPALETLLGLLPLLGQVPIDPRIQEGGDTGRPIVAAEPDSKAAKAISSIAERVMQRVVERYG